MLSFTPGMRPLEARSVYVHSPLESAPLPLDVEAGHLGAVIHIGIRPWLTLYRLGIS